MRNSKVLVVWESSSLHVVLKGQYLWLVFRPSSRVFHILMADGVHDINEILVRVNGVEKLLLFLRGYPGI